MNDKLSEAIEVLKDYRKGDFVGDDDFCKAIDTVVSAFEKPLPTGIMLHECPMCKQKSGKTYLAARLPTICQKCDHIWLRG